MEISRKVFKDINEIFQLANTASDPKQFMSRMIQFLFKQVSAESSVAYFTNTATSKGDIEINLDQAFVQQYKTYYYQQDPVRWIGRLKNNPVILMEDLIDYKKFMSGEFYNDFLMPQKIHHKLYLNLYSGPKHYARIGLYRSNKAKRFSRNDIRILKMISPHLGHAMDHHSLLLSSRRQNIFFNILDENSSKGVILLDDALQLIQMNQTAKQICTSILKNDSGQNETCLPSPLIEDCQALDNERRKSQSSFLPLPRNRILTADDMQKLSVSTRILSREVTSENKQFFLIAIEKSQSPQEMLQARLEKKYKLTARECEIVLHLFNGLKNAEIAKKIFLSEITVKKHVQHIFKKLKVKNRASVVRKIAEEHQTNTPSL